MPHRFSASVSGASRAIAHRINVVPTSLRTCSMPDPRAQWWPSASHSAARPRAPAAGAAPRIRAKFGIGVIETFAAETNAPCFPTRSPRRRRSEVPGRLRQRAKVIDPAAAATSPCVAGEIMVRATTLRYYKDPEATARTLRPDGWMHTGDVGYLDADGYLFVTGRIKEIIIKGGENIAPREIDEVLLRHPAVLEAAAVGIPDTRYGQEIMACICSRAPALPAT